MNEAVHFIRKQIARPLAQCSSASYLGSVIIVGQSRDIPTGQPVRGNSDKLKIGKQLL